MAYKQKGLSTYLQKSGLLKIVGVLFLVVAVAAGIYLANNPETLVFDSGASSKPVTFVQALQLNSDGQGFKVSSEKEIFNLQDFTVEGWFKLNATPPLTKPQVLFKLGNSQGESGAGLGSFVVYLDRPNALNYGGTYTNTKGSLVVGLNTEPYAQNPQGGFKIYASDPVTTEKDANGNFIIGPGLFDQNWHHLAVSVSSSTLNQRRNGVPIIVGVYIDGKNTTPYVVNGSKVVGSFTTGAIKYASPNSFYIGADVFGSSMTAFQGQIDEVRLSKVARYTKDFTPRNKPFKDDVNTVTLLHLDGSIVPDKGTKGTVNIFGSPTFVSSFQ